MPLLQISIPELPEINANEWNTEEHIPLVAYGATDESTEIYSFNSKGEQIILNKNIVPENLVVVISENERLKAFQKTKTSGRLKRVEECPQLASIEPYYSTSQYDYYNITDLNYCYPTEPPYDPPSPPPSGSTACDRDRKNTKDELNKMKFTSMTAYKAANEGWFDSRLEMQVTIFFGTKAGEISKVTKYFTGKEHEFKNCGLFNCNPEWFEMYFEVITWDRSKYGDIMLYSWIERDGGEETNHSAEFTSNYKNDDNTTTSTKHSVSYKIKDEDDLLGESIVEYCDNTDGEGYLYKPGDIEFYVRQK
ncbi:MAG: hypothetical protein ACNS62_24760 [Candidatus Cyclobacteriaceae bacterium M3_2C_046]